MSIIDMAGKKIGRLFVESLVEDSLGSGVTKWKCLCECGKTAEVLGASLRKQGGTRSCGCIRNEVFLTKQNSILNYQRRGSAHPSAVPITYNGVTLIKSQWAKKMGISTAGLTYRLKNSTVEEVFSKAFDNPYLK